MAQKEERDNLGSMQFFEPALTTTGSRVVEMVVAQCTLQK